MTAFIHEWLTPQGLIVIGMAYSIFQAHRAARRAAANAANIAKLELNTNSIQEKLNVANLDLGHAQGKAEGRAEMVAERQDTVKGS